MDTETNIKGLFKERSLSTKLTLASLVLTAGGTLADSTVVANKCDAHQSTHPIHQSKDPTYRPFGFRFIPSRPLNC